MKKKAPKMTAEMKEFFRETGSVGGKKAAKGMSAEARKARAVKASKAAAAKRKRGMDLG